MLAPAVSRWIDGSRRDCQGSDMGAMSADPGEVATKQCLAAGLTGFERQARGEKGRRDSLGLRVPDGELPRSGAP